MTGKLRETNKNRLKWEQGSTPQNYRKFINNLKMTAIIQNQHPQITTN